ncbi:uncharacterized protein BDR25DRAFT_358596 [Lindgomyces ingoldianus]|uniref:Uncharacterized protein n=1 Tax=Lindgomyces ingoldianus TaxID=673940 RepID=A0ACB6QLM6_9PLEO|nr:uncharacterized protein BDR25DRAFT_358596 [Lindgomyces ingoldianus]KAF2467483.1 hypothetical protein BDR25DRAFT_358596 [Lindgomyces ingoldianus]
MGSKLNLEASPNDTVTSKDFVMTIALGIKGSYSDKKPGLRARIEDKQEKEEKNEEKETKGLVEIISPNCFITMQPTMLEPFPFFAYHLKPRTWHKLEQSPKFKSIETRLEDPSDALSKNKRKDPRAQKRKVISEMLHEYQEEQPTRSVSKVNTLPPWDKASSEHQSIALCNLLFTPPQLLANCLHNAYTKECTSHHRTISQQAYKLMPVRDCLASSMLIEAATCSDVGKAVLQDLIELYLQEEGKMSTIDTRPIPKAILCYLKRASTTGYILLQRARHGSAGRDRSSMPMPGFLGEVGIVWECSLGQSTTA